MKENKERANYDMTKLSNKTYKKNYTIKYK